jgi:uncharacterized protein YlxW (UPF0749 family)
MSTQPATPSPAAVRNACAQITSTGMTVTFTAVAEQTGISRTTLYRRPDLRQLVEQHREARRDDLAQLATQVSQLQQALEAVAATVRRHDEQLRALKRASRVG